MELLQPRPGSSKTVTAPKRPVAQLSCTPQVAKGSACLTASLGWSLSDYARPQPEAKSPSQAGQGKPLSETPCTSEEPMQVASIRQSAQQLTGTGEPEKKLASLSSGCSLAMGNGTRQRQAVEGNGEMVKPPSVGNDICDSLEVSGKCSSLASVENVPCKRGKCTPDDLAESDAPCSSATMYAPVKRVLKNPTSSTGCSVTRLSDELPPLHNGSLHSSTDPASKFSFTYVHCSVSSFILHLQWGFYFFLFWINSTCSGVCVLGTCMCINCRMPTKEGCEMNTTFLSCHGTSKYMCM